MNTMGFNSVLNFETSIKSFFNAPYGIAVDCCTHGLELCLRYEKVEKINVPKHTYLSIPMLANKLGIKLEWKEENWKNYYYISNNIIDAAVYWKKNSYINNTYFVVSFQFKKHLSLGRGGIILTDNKKAADTLRRMSYDGRQLNKKWTEQDIDSIGYHYYMTPETAELGLTKLENAINKSPKIWSYKDYPNLTNLKVFQNG